MCINFAQECMVKFKTKLVRLFRICSVASIVLVHCSCSTGPVSGLLFTKTQYAGEFNPANDVKFVKEGSSCQHQILGLVTLGSSGAGKTAMNAGIQKVALVDHSTLSILHIVYSQYCTHVYGE